MHRTADNQRNRNFSGKSLSAKNKNTFDLINEIPHVVYKEPNNKNTIEYAGLLMKAAETLYPKQYKKLEFFPESDNVFSFIIDLELLILNENDLIFENTIYIHPEEPNKITVAIPDCVVDCLYIVHISNIYKIKNRELRVSCAHFYNCFANMGYVNPFKKEYEWEDYFYDFAIEYESCNYESNEIDEELENEDNRYYRKQKHELEFNKKYIKNHNYIRSLLNHHFNLEHYHPRTEQNKLLKSFFIEFFEAYNEFNINDYMFSSSAINDGAPNFEESFMLLPEDDRNGNRESESRDGRFGNYGSCGILDSLLHVTTKKSNKEKKEESVKRFNRLMTAIYNVVTNL
jgi:hypothetical protein